MGSMFSSPKPVATPPPPAPTPVAMPDTDSDAVAKERRRKLTEMQSRSGRASTILTDTTGKLGG